MLLLVISLEHYSAPSRIFLLNLTSSLKLPLRTFEQDECITAEGLLERAKDLAKTQKSEEQESSEKQEMRKKQVRYASLAGAAIVGVAGGYAAPLLAAGVGSLASGLGLGTTAAAGYLGSVAGSSLVVGSLFGAYGGRMTGEMMNRYAREVRDFEFIRVHTPYQKGDGKDAKFEKIEKGEVREEVQEGKDEAEQKGSQKESQKELEEVDKVDERDHRLRVTICLSGWLREKEEVVKPWRVLGTGSEVFALKYELEALLELGHAMDGMVQSAAWGYAQREMVKRTVFAELMAGLWPMGVLKVARVLDNPFSVAKRRAEKVGEVLADALINRAQGERPVTLIGYSLGARAIFVCLRKLAERGALHLVENAVLIGAPVPSDSKEWREVRSVVAGRVVNVYSANDYVLGFMYRTSAVQFGVAGLQAVELTGVENVDVSEEVDGHLRYRFLIGGILKKIGWDVDLDVVKVEQAELERMKKEEEKNSLQSQRKRFLRQESYRKEGKVDEDKQAEDEASEMEKDVKEKTQESLMKRVIEWWYAAKNFRDEGNAEKVASTVQQALQDPSQIGAVVNDTAQDVRGSAANMAQRVYQALPNVRNVGNKDSTGKVAEADSKEAQSQSYTSRAAAYLPQSMPSMPNMPNIPGYRKKDTTSKPAKLAKDAGATTKKSTKTATDAVGTTVKNVTNVNDNPATEQLKQTPGIKQAVDRDPGVTQTLGKVTGLVGTTVGNTTDQAINATNKVVDKAGEGGVKAADTVDSSAQKSMKAGKTLAGKDEKPESTQQSYTSRAASYLPSLPSWKSSAGSDTPNEQPAGQSLFRSKPPKLERRGSSQVKATAPKLEHRGSSQLKSKPPKLGPRKASDSGVKSPLQRVNSGTGEAENLPNIAEQISKSGKDVGGKVAKTGQDSASSVANAGQKGVSSAAKTTQDTALTAVKTGSDGAKSVASQGQSAVSSGTNAAQGVVGGAFAGGKKMFGLGK